MMITCKFGRLWHGETAVVLQDSDSVGPRKPVKVGIRGFGAKKEGAAGALVGGRYCFDDSEKILLAFLLLLRRLGLKSFVPGNARDASAASARDQHAAAHPHHG